MTTIAPIALAAAGTTTLAVLAARVGWPGRRIAALLGGAVALAAAAAVGEQGGLSAHMAEHSLIAFVAAPLFALSGPVALVLRALRPSGRARLLHVLRSRPVAALTHPAVTWTLFVAAIWVAHLTPALRASESAPLLHGAEHAGLLAVSMLFWLPVLGANPLPHRLEGGARSAYLFGAVGAGDLAGAIFIGQGNQEAGAVMLAGMLPLALAAVLVTWRWLAQEERRAVRLEGAQGA